MVSYIWKVLTNVILIAFIAGCSGSYVKMDYVILCPVPSDTKFKGSVLPPLKYKVYPQLQVVVSESGFKWGKCGIYDKDNWICEHDIEGLARAMHEGKFLPRYKRGLSGAIRVRVGELRHFLLGFSDDLVKAFCADEAKSKVFQDVAAGR